MTGEERRNRITEMLKESREPLSGTALAKAFGVSRQVIVQDIALLRATNKNILSTNKGYLLFGQGQEKACRRIFAVSHTDGEMEEELCLIVDAGARLLDVIVEHEVYGQLSADLRISSRKDVEEFLGKMNAPARKPLKVLTGGSHYHTVEADSEEILDAVEQALAQAGFLKKDGNA